MGDRLEDANPWKRGLPPGKYYEGMTRDFEVYFSPGGEKWHRRRDMTSLPELARETEG